MTGWDCRDTNDAVTRWTICLVEPLVPLRRLIPLDAALAEATSADPELVALIFAGVTADVVRTLPSEDSWRSVVLCSHWQTARTPSVQRVSRRRPQAPLAHLRSVQVAARCPQGRLAALSVRHWPTGRRPCWVKSARSCKSPAGHGPQAATCRLDACWDRAA